MTPHTLTTAEKLMAELRRVGVILMAKEDRLVFDAPAGVMKPDVLAIIKSHKFELLALLQQPSDATRDPRPATTSASSLSSEPTLSEKWFQLGASAPRRESFAEDPETGCRPEWWGYLYELHNRGLALVNGRVVKDAMGKHALISARDLPNVSKVSAYPATEFGAKAPNESMTNGQRLSS
jgi:hypothetical protein